MAAATALAVAVALASGAPAFASGPVVAQKSRPGYDITLTQTAGGTIDASITNTDTTAHSFGLGATLTDPNTVQQLWQDGFIGEVAHTVIEPGQTHTAWFPIRAGVQFVVYRDIETSPEALLAWRAPGRFAPLTLTTTPTDLTLQFGNPVSISPQVSRAGEAPRITVGGFGSVTSAEVWLLTQDQVENDFSVGGDDPFALKSVGGMLLGTVPVTNGTADGNVALPSTLAPGSYALLVGDSTDQWWPGGPRFVLHDVGDPTLESLQIEAGAPRGTTPASGGAPVSVTPVDQYGATPVSFTFDGGVTTGGTTSVTTSATGPTPSGFSPLVGAPAYYTLDTTAQFTGTVTVCIRFDTSGLAPEAAAQQSLYHYVNGTWTDITTSRDVGIVCGATSSFSPFAVGKAGGWTFDGFLSPIANDVVNAVQPGSTVPIRFRLGADRGLAVFAAGSPASGTIATCSTSARPTTTDPAVSASIPSITYTKSSGIYAFQWRTDKAWKRTCRQLVVTLADGTVHRATFDFRTP